MPMRAITLFFTGLCFLVSMIPVLHAGMINAGFDSGDLNGWTTFGQGWRAGVGDDAYRADYGVVNDVITNDVDGFRGIFQNVSVEAGATYHAGVYIRTVGLTSSESWFELQWLNASGEVIGSYESPHVTESQAFQLAALPFIEAPAGAVTASVRGVVFMNNSPVDNNNFHIFDEFFIENINEIKFQATWSASNITFSWSTNTPGYQVEKTMNMDGNDWSAIPGIPELSGDRFVVTGVTDSAIGIYRLRKP